eukprot:778153-Karenia_brevis.AAC.1
MDSWAGGQDFARDERDDLSGSNFSDDDFASACRKKGTSSRKDDPFREELLEKEQLAELRGLLDVDEETMLKQLRDRKQADEAKAQADCIPTECGGRTINGHYTPCCFGKDGGPATTDQLEMFPVSRTACLWCTPEVIAECINVVDMRMEIFKAIKAVEQHYPVNVDAQFGEEPLQGSLLKAIALIPEDWQPFFRK